MSVKTILEVDNELCKLWADEDTRIPGAPIIHLNIKTWGKRESILWKFIWEQFKAALRYMGYNYVFALVPEHNTKLYKFSRQSGMKEFDRLNGIIVMRSEV